MRMKNKTWKESGCSEEGNIRLYYDNGTIMFVLIVHRLQIGGAQTPECCLYILFLWSLFVFSLPRIFSYICWNISRLWLISIEERIIKCCSISFFQNSGHFKNIIKLSGHPYWAYDSSRTPLQKIKRKNPNLTGSNFCLSKSMLTFFSPSRLKCRMWAMQCLRYPTHSNVLQIFGQCWTERVKSN